MDENIDQNIGKNIDENIEESIDENDGVEDYKTLSIEEDNDEKNSYPNLEIKIERVQYSIFELNRRHERGSIMLDPTFQRNFVWKNKQKSELIESVIMGIPLPLIYLAENRDGNLIVVDGRQRLTTFFDFLNNKFTLRDLKILTKINKMKFEDLEKEYPQYATMIEDFQLTIQIIKFPTPDRVRFDIFDRVNRGGTPLNKQEMRNALYQGKATVLLKELSESNEFIQATGNAINSEHMKDRYIILRAISIYMWKIGMLKDVYGNPVEYKSDMEDFLGNSMQFLNSLTIEQIEDIETIFKEIMLKTYKILGKDAFRIPTNLPQRRPISMTLFETLFYYFSLCLKENDNEKIKKSVQELLQNEEFINYLEKTVDSSTRLNKRLEMVEKKYEEEFKC